MGNVQRGHDGDLVGIHYLAVLLDQINLALQQPDRSSRVSRSSSGEPMVK
jgi:hypothetical protein